MIGIREIVHATTPQEESMSQTSIEKHVAQILDRASHPSIRFVRDYRELGLIVDMLKVSKKRIVMTKGVYDMIHVGHLRYLEKARAHGDILVVSIDSDRLTKQRKGDTRPVVPEDERIEMLIGLRSVDIVIVRDVNSPHEQYDVEVVQPHVLITSSTTADFTQEVKDKISKEYGVEIITLEAQAVTTTSARIRILMTQGVEEFVERMLMLVQEFTGKNPGVSR